MRDNKFAADLLDMMDKKFDEKLEPIKKGMEDINNDFSEMHGIFDSLNANLDKIDENNLETCSTCDRILEIAQKMNDMNFKRDKDFWLEQAETHYCS